MYIRSNSFLLRAGLLACLMIAFMFGLVFLSNPEGARGAQDKDKKNAEEAAPPIPAFRAMQKAAPRRGGLSSGRATLTPSENAPVVPWPLAARRRKASPEEITQWLKELGDNSFKAREAAGKALVEVGQPALRGLEAALHGGDVEVSRRAEAMIEKIEINEALAPTAIDLKVADMPVPEVIAGFNNQSRIKLELVPQQGPARKQMEQRKINLELDGVPFWEALDRVCDAGGLTVVSLSQSRAQLQLAEGTGNVRAPTAYSGPFRMRVTGMNYFRNLSMVEPGVGVVQPGMNMAFAQANAQAMQMAIQQPVAGVHLGGSRPVRQESLTAGMDVLCEPHLNLVNIGAPTITAADGDEGQSLLPTLGAANAVYGQAIYGSVAGAMQLRQSQFTLQPATKPAANLKVLRGTLPVEVLVHRKPVLTVNNFLADKAKIYKGEGDVTIAILQVQDNGNGRSGTIRFFLTGADRPANNAFNNGFNNNVNGFNPNFNPGPVQAGFEVTDAQGQPYHLNQNINYNPNSAERSLEGNLFFTATTPNIGPATRLVYHSNKAIRTSVPFEFRNVPMP